MGAFPGAGNHPKQLMMKRKCLVLISCCFVFFVASFGQTPAITAKIDSLFKNYNTINTPGYAIGIFKNQKILLAKGYGMANLEYNIPITANTVFNIASLSKQFTAACIALLIMRDSISLDDEVSKYIPAVARYHQSIKVKHLVYFTSGIHEYHLVHRNNGLNWNMYDYFTVDTAIAASLSRDTLDFVPGTKWAYSNTDYMLLARIVEKVSGKTLQEFITENFFKPLGMKSSQVNDDVTAIVRNRASGYITRTSKLVADAQTAGFYLRNDGAYVQVHRNAPHYGGSGVLTSVNDWYLWDKNFYTHKVGGATWYGLMHMRAKFEHSKYNDAFGLVFGQYRGQEIVWYSGGDIGFNSYVMRFPKQQTTIVCFSNLDTGGNAEKMAKLAADILASNKLLMLDPE